MHASTETVFLNFIFPSLVSEAEMSSAGRRDGSYKGLEGEEGACGNNPRRSECLEGRRGHSAETWLETWTGTCDVGL